MKVDKQTGESDNIKFQGKFNKIGMGLLIPEFQLCRYFYYQSNHTVEDKTVVKTNINFYYKFLNCSAFY